MSSPQPINIGALKLQHRVVLAPLTCYRSTRSHVPVLPLVKEYYTASSRPGSKADQFRAWKEVTDQVHANGSHIFVQLWALGRFADPKVLSDEGNFLVGPSPIPIASRPTPLLRELTEEEIHEYAVLFAQAAKNAIKNAEFDGVEIHGANGYLFHQFLQEESNQRTDSYGGSIEGRSKFGLEVVNAVVEAKGAERTAIRLNQHPNLAYVHLVEPRIAGSTDQLPGAHESNDFIRAIWKPAPLIIAGGYTRETVIAAAEMHKSELVAFGRHCISNPDLPRRIEKNLPLTPYDRKTFYAPVGDQECTEHGYIDYPFYVDESRANL